MWHAACESEQAAGDRNLNDARLGQVDAEIQVRYATRSRVAEFDEEQLDDPVELLLEHFRSAKLAPHNLREHVH